MTETCDMTNLTRRLQRIEAAVLVSADDEQARKMREHCQEEIRKYMEALRQYARERGGEVENRGPRQRRGTVGDWNEY